MTEAVGAFSHHGGHRVNRDGDRLVCSCGWRGPRSSAPWETRLVWVEHSEVVGPIGRAVPPSRSAQRQTVLRRVRREAEAEERRAAERAQGRRRMPPGVFADHGTYARYQRGPDGPCRCEECRQASRDYHRAHRRN